MPLGSEYVSYGLPQTSRAKQVDRHLRMAVAAGHPRAYGTVYLVMPDTASDTSDSQ